MLRVYSRYTSIDRFPKELMSLFSLRVRDPISTWHFWQKSSSIDLFFSSQPAIKITVIKVIAKIMIDFRCKQIL